MRLRVGGILSDHAHFLLCLGHRCIECALASLRLRLVAHCDKLPQLVHINRWIARGALDHADDGPGFGLNRDKLGRAFLSQCKSSHCFSPYASVALSKSSSIRRSLARVETS